MITYAENGGSTGVSLTMSDDGKLQLRYNGALSKDEISLEMIRDARSIAEKFLQTLKSLEAPAIEAKRSRLLAELAALDEGQPPKRLRTVKVKDESEIATLVLTALEKKPNISTSALFTFLQSDYGYKGSKTFIYNLTERMKKDSMLVSMPGPKGAALWSVMP